MWQALPGFKWKLRTALSPQKNYIHTTFCPHLHGLQIRNFCPISFYRWGNWGSERLNDLPKITQPIHSRARTWTLASQSPIWHFTTLRLPNSGSNFFFSLNMAHFFLKCYLCLHLFQSPLDSIVFLSQEWQFWAHQDCVFQAIMNSCLLARGRSRIKTFQECLSN